LCRVMANTAEMGRSEGITRLERLHAKLGKLVASKIDLTAVEEEIRGALDEVGCEMMKEVFSAASVDDLEIRVNGVLHSRTYSRTDTVHTTFGAVPVEQWVYGRGKGHPTVAPMEKLLGLVERFYTPKCTKVLCHLAAVVVRQEAAELLRELGGISVGEATMHRLPLKIMARYERDREVIEPVIRERSAIPEDAVSVQIGLDGVMVPMDGEHCDPRGREPSDGEPDPPRHERAYGVVTPPGPTADDGKMGAAWHEASVGTLAFFDGEGEHLSTVYLGRMPEAKKATLTAMLKAEAEHTLAVRPDLLPIMASDGALGQWESLAEITAALPSAARDRAVWLVDFHHVAGHLQDACNAIDGQGSAAAQVRRHGFGETMKAYDDGAERVIQRLHHYRRNARKEADRDEIDSVVGFLRNNRARTAYKSAIDRKLPIATGPVEAAAKTLVGVRMKRSGARFDHHGGQSVLTLRASLKSRRFRDLFDIIGASYKAAVTRRAA
jgi:hypothetical protein